MKMQHIYSYLTEVKKTLTFLGHNDGVLENRSSVLFFPVSQLNNLFPSFPSFWWVSYSALLQLELLQSCDFQNLDN